MLHVLSIGGCLDLKMGMVAIWEALCCETSFRAQSSRDEAREQG